MIVIEIAFDSSALAMSHIIQKADAGIPLKSAAFRAKPPPTNASIAPLPPRILPNPPEGPPPDDPPDPPLDPPGPPPPYAIPAALALSAMSRPIVRPAEDVMLQRLCVSGLDRIKAELLDSLSMTASQLPAKERPPLPSTLNT